MLGSHGQMGQIHLHRAAALPDNIALGNVQLRRRAVQHFGCIGQNMLFQQRAGLGNGEALHIGLAAGVGS